MKLTKENFKDEKSLKNKIKEQLNNFDSIDEDIPKIVKKEPKVNENIRPKEEINETPKDNNFDSPQNDLNQKKNSPPEIDNKENVINSSAVEPPNSTTQNNNDDDFDSHRNDIERLSKINDKLNLGEDVETDKSDPFSISNPQDIARLNKMKEKYMGIPPPKEIIKHNVVKKISKNLRLF